MTSLSVKRLVFLSLLIFSSSAAAQTETNDAERRSGAQATPLASSVVSTRTSVAADFKSDFRRNVGFAPEANAHCQREVCAPIRAAFSFDARQIKTVGGDFRSTEQRERYGGSKGAEKFSFRPARRHADAPDEQKDLPADESFKWLSATKQTLMFLAVQHGYAATQAKTREALKGKFWKDYGNSVKNLHGWADGGRFFTNYIAHPMQGAFLGYIQVQNDPKGAKQQFAQSPEYWRSRLKAMAWSAAWSTQFEIGPLSQASIGNVGLKGKQTYIDIVVTPTVGTAWLVAEDAVDLFVTKPLERYSNNFYLRIFARMLLSPTRTIANVFRFKEPWYRDRPVAVR